MVEVEVALEVVEAGLVVEDQAEEGSRRTKRRAKMLWEQTSLYISLAVYVGAVTMLAVGGIWKGIMALSAGCESVKK